MVSFLVLPFSVSLQAMFVLWVIVYNFVFSRLEFALQVPCRLYQSIFVAPSQGAPYTCFPIHTFDSTQTSIHTYPSSYPSMHAYMHIFHHPFTQSEFTCCLSVSPFFAFIFASPVLSLYSCYSCFCFTFLQ